MGRLVQLCRFWSSGIIAVLLVLSSVSSEAQSTVYQYTDDHGVIGYTDDLGSIPQRYRARAKLIELRSAQHSSPQAQGSPAPSGANQEKPKDEGTNRLQHVWSRVQELAPVDHTNGLRIMMIAFAVAGAGVMIRLWVQVPPVRQVLSLIIYVAVLIGAYAGYRGGLVERLEALTGSASQSSAEQPTVSSPLAAPAGYVGKVQRAVDEANEARRVREAQATEGTATTAGENPRQ